jgi:hypothetical protein
VRKESDITMALTHLSFADDQIVLRKLKKLRLVMGGHDMSTIILPGERLPSLKRCQCEINIPSPGLPRWAWKIANTISAAYGGFHGGPG